MTNIEELIHKIRLQKTPNELALGYLRYEAIRKCHIKKYADMWMDSHTPFDTLVDAEILNQNERNRN